MSIRFFNEDVNFPDIRKRVVSAWLKEIISLHDKKVGDISIIFCSDSYLLDVNKQYLEHDYFTDIITFDYVEGNMISGDIFISVDRVLENSKLFKVSFSEELHRIMAHGVLHLLGYKDKCDEDKVMMTEKENFSLRLLSDKF
jgi:rRNA maturation RNase YbeY